MPILTHLRNPHIPEDIQEIAQRERMQAQNCLEQQENLQPQLRAIHQRVEATLKAIRSELHRQTDVLQQQIDDNTEKQRQAQDRYERAAHQFNQTIRNQIAREEGESKLQGRLDEINRRQACTQGLLNAKQRALSEIREQLNGINQTLADTRANALAQWDRILASATELEKAVADLDRQLENQADVFFRNVDRRILQQTGRQSLSSEHHVHLKALRAGFKRLAVTQAFTAGATPRDDADALAEWINCDLQPGLRKLLDEQLRLTAKPAGWTVTQTIGFVLAAALLIASVAKALQIWRQSVLMQTHLLSNMSGIWSGSDKMLFENDMRAFWVNSLQFQRYLAALYARIPDLASYLGKSINDTVNLIRYACGPEVVQFVLEKSQHSEMSVHCSAVTVKFLPDLRYSVAKQMTWVNAILQVDRCMSENQKSFESCKPVLPDDQVFRLQVIDPRSRWVNVIDQHVKWSAAALMDGLIAHDRQRVGETITTPLFSAAERAGLHMVSALLMVGFIALAVRQTYLRQQFDKQQGLLLDTGFQTLEGLIDRLRSKWLNADELNTTALLEKVRRAAAQYTLNKNARPTLPAPALPSTSGVLTAFNVPRSGTESIWGETRPTQASEQWLEERSDIQRLKQRVQDLSENAYQKNKAEISALEVTLRTQKDEANQLLKTVEIRKEKEHMRLRQSGTGLDKAYVELNQINNALAHAKRNMEALILRTDVEKAAVIAAGTDASDRLKQNLAELKDAINLGNVAKNMNRFITPAAWDRVMERHFELSDSALVDRLQTAQFDNTFGQSVLAHAPRSSTYASLVHLQYAVSDTLLRLKTVLSDPESIAHESGHGNIHFTVNHGRKVGRTAEWNADDSLRIMDAHASQARACMTPTGWKIDHLYPV